MSFKRTAEERELNRAFIDALRGVLGMSPLYNAEASRDDVERFYVEPREHVTQRTHPLRRRAAA